MQKQKTPHQNNQPDHSQQKNNVVAQQWVGPLPPPGALQQFNNIIPDGAERIMKMVEQEQAHRIQYESTLLTARVQDTKRSHWMGALISVFAIGCAIGSILLGAHPLVSVAFLGLPIVSIIKAILDSKSS